MNRILASALGAFFMIATLTAPHTAHAEGITRVCDQVVDRYGQNNCPETFSSSTQAALSTTVKQVKATGGIVSIVHCWNPNSTPIFVQIFNALPANVTLGTTPPIAFVPIAATSTGGWSISPLALGSLRTAISVAATTTATGSGAPSTAPDCDIYYN